MLIPPSPKHISETRIYRQLLAKASPEDGIAERARTFVETAEHFLDLVISGPFKEYTLHNRDHAKRILHLAGYIISPQTINELSEIECLVLLYAAYLHDMGLTVTFAERQSLVESDGFLDSLRSWRELHAALNDTRRKLAHAEEGLRLRIEAEIFQLQEAALANYLRPIHAIPDRYIDIINLIKRSSGREDLFSLHGASFEEILTDICVSHNLGASVLGELHGAYEERYPRSLPVGGRRLNAQFCAAVLRLCDILDFDRERTPRILFESLGIKARMIPGAEISLLEWNKHLAVHTIDVKDEEIVIFGECEHPAIERAIRDFCLEIEREVRESLAVVRRNPPEIIAKYQLQLPASVRASIRSRGYVYKDFLLRLDENAIMNLLMGHELYSEPAAAARELIQNSVDACALRSRLEVRSGFVPKISISSDKDFEGRDWLIVCDNGIGMDEHVLANFFFSIGRSYYDSVEFERLARTYKIDTFRPVSRFGIGILSTFMIGDILEVYTRSAHSMYGDNVGRTLRVERMGALAYVTEDSKGPLGTEVRVRLKSPQTSQNEFLLDRILGYIRANVLRPTYSIDVSINGKRHSIPPCEFYSLLANAEDVAASKQLEIISVDIGHWSELVSGKAFLLLSVNSANGLLHHFAGGKKISFNPGLRPEKYFHIDPNLLVRGYEGNRISVNGFRMALKNPSQLSGITMIIDVDVAADKQVRYNVSRSKVIQTGAVLVRSEIRNAVLGALDDLGYLERLSEETRTVLHTSRKGPAQLLPVSDITVLAAVERQLPSGEWPKGLHRIIAERLGIPNSLAFRAISTILAKRGRGGSGSGGSSGFEKKGA